MSEKASTAPAAGSAVPKRMSKLDLAMYQETYPDEWVRKLAQEARLTRDENELVLAMLRRLEWLPDAGGNLCCPECFGHALHEPGCALRDILTSAASARSAPESIEESRGGGDQE